MKKHLIIVGFMGTGKTTVGKQTAALLDLPWLDTDQLLEEKWGYSIAHFFQAYGESAFRDEETEMLRQTLNSFTPTLITTGGGIVLRSENQTMMKQKGWVVALTAQPEEVIRRCRLQSDQTRPLLQGNLEEKVRQLFAERAGKYDFADLLIDTTKLSIQEVMEQICIFWNDKQV